MPPLRSDWRAAGSSLSQCLPKEYNPEVLSAGMKMGKECSNAFTRNLISVTTPCIQVVLRGLLALVGSAHELPRPGQ